VSADVLFYGASIYHLKKCPIYSLLWQPDVVVYDNCICQEPATVQTYVEVMELKSYEGPALWQTRLEGTWLEWKQYCKCRFHCIQGDLPVSTGILRYGIWRRVEVGGIEDGIPFCPLCNGVVMRRPMGWSKLGLLELAPMPVADVAAASSSFLFVGTQGLLVQAWCRRIWTLYLPVEACLPCC
jgi:hypothetical protein